MVIAVQESSIDVIKQCTDVLDRIINDDSVPRNIRRSAENIKKVLSSQKEPVSTRCAQVISKLDDISNDPNIPIHTRTMIWSLSSRLESAQLSN
jgi:uncharacterized protein (UPF0147 family)